MLRSSLALLLLLIGLVPAHAQRLEGTLLNGAKRKLMLYECRGEHCEPIDSTRVGDDGRFAMAPHLPGPGLYLIGLNDTDRVDVIFDTREPLVHIDFTGRPLAEHIQVRRSDENMRMWELRAVSREADAVLATTMQTKATLAPTDYVALRQQDSIAARADQERTAHVQRLIASAPDGYFAKLTRADAGLNAAIGQGPMEVSKVFDFSDPSLLRSSLYDKAIMTFLRNVNAVHEDQFLVASDTLMTLAGRDPDCTAYMLEHLLDLFSTYGPDRAAQYLLDKFVMQAKVPVRMSPGLRARVDDMLKVAVGATGTDLTLNDSGKPFLLSEEAKLHKYTLLFFYSSTCEHCHAEIPKLEETYSTYAPKGLGVVGIALDADSSEFQQRIAESAIPWLSTSEFIGWGARSAKVYQVKATPAFYLLDQHLRIVAKPYDAAELATLMPGFLP